MESCSWVGNLNTIKIQIIPYDRQAPRWPPVTPTSWYSHPCIVLSHTEPGWSMWPPVCGRRDGVPLLRLRGKDCGFCLVHPLSSLLPHFILFFLFFIFLAVLGLRCCVQAILELRRAGATLCCGARASYCGGFSCCRARAQQLWRTGLVAPRHVGSSRTRAQTHVPCIGRWILNHYATREVPGQGYF